MKIKIQGDFRVDMEKVKERIQNFILSNVVIVKSLLFEYKRLYRQNSELKGSVQKLFFIIKSDFFQSEYFVLIEEKMVIFIIVVKLDGIEKLVFISIFLVIQKDIFKFFLEIKLEIVIIRRFVRQSVLILSDNVEVKFQVSFGSLLNVLIIFNEILKQIVEVNNFGVLKFNFFGVNRT